MVPAQAMAAAFAVASDAGAQPPHLVGQLTFRHPREIFIHD
jgi:hypothetical protein